METQFYFLPNFFSIKSNSGRTPRYPEQLVLGPVKYVQVEGGPVIGLPVGTSAPGEFEEGAGLSSVNRLPVLFHPFSDSLKALNAWFRELSLCGGTHIKQQVASLSSINKDKVKVGLR